MRQSSLFLAVGLVAVLMAGCAISRTPEAIAQNDPYESTNRAVFKANMAIDGDFVKPVAKFYNHAVPVPVRDGIHNFLTNLDKPVIFSNDLLQSRAARASETLERFTLNTTLGVGGLFDAATTIGVPDHSGDFGLTLGAWGVGEGPYLVLPLLGPAPPRDLTGDVVDIFMDPLTYIKFHGSDTWYAVRTGANVLDLRARNVDTIEQIERTSIDFYATTRNLYRQYRNSKIRDGATDTKDMPDL